MSRIDIQRGDTAIAVGKDHVFGFFAQVYTNGSHSSECDCAQCDFDMPAFELDNAGSWTAAIRFVREKTGIDITADVVGV